MEYLQLRGDGIGEGGGGGCGEGEVGKVERVGVQHGLVIRLQTFQFRPLSGQRGHVIMWALSLGRRAEE